MVKNCRNRNMMVREQASRKLFFSRRESMEHPPPRSLPLFYHLLTSIKKLSAQRIVMNKTVPNWGFGNRLSESILGKNGMGPPPPFYMSPVVIMLQCTAYQDCPWSICWATEYPNMSPVLPLCLTGFSVSRLKACTGLKLRIKEHSKTDITGALLLHPATISLLSLRHREHREESWKVVLSATKLKSHGLYIMITYRIVRKIFDLRWNLQSFTINT